MNLVRSKYWPLVVFGGFVVSFILSFILLFLNLMEMIPPHFWVLDFLPFILWIIVAILLVRVYGSQKQKEIQKELPKIAWCTISGIIAFWGALILGIFSLKENSKILFILTILLFYSLWYLSWFLLKRYSTQRKIKILWKTLWIMTGALFFLAVLGQLSSFIAGYIGSAIIWVGGIALVYRLWGKKFFQELKQKQVAFQVLLFLAFNLLSFIFWTAIFLFFSYFFFFK